LRIRVDEIQRVISESLLSNEKLDRQRLKTWQTRFYRELYRAADLLPTDPHQAERFAA
jgi:hypothetical protein